MGRKAWVGGLVLMLALAVGLGLKRDQLLTWYYVRGLAQAGEDKRETWVERVVRLDEAGVPALLGCLTQDNLQACTNGRVALAGLIEKWGPHDPRIAKLFGQLAKAFPNLSVPGRENVLELAAGWWQSIRADSAVPTIFSQTTAGLMNQAVRDTDPGIRAPALTLAEAFLTKIKPGEFSGTLGELTGACLSDAAPEIRLRAVKLALRPGIHLVKQLVPLLNDPVPEVRRAAMLAVGPTEAITEDELIHWLHDPDPDNRHLCEKALKSRGLSDEMLKLARLKTDGDPKIRLEVLEYLPSTGKIDPGVWLRSLSHDEAPAVRAAVLRAAAELTNFDLTDRFEQMVQNDPSPTIRQLARYYLAYPKAHQFPK